MLYILLYIVMAHGCYGFGSMLLVASNHIKW